MSQFDPFVRYYDLDYDDFDDDLLLYQGYAQQLGGPILELMCGTGRVALPLAEAGFDVVGVDISGSMLDRARSKLAERRLSGKLELIQADVRRLSLERTFDLAIIAINSFMHLETAEDQLATLQALTRHLNPGGAVIVDLFNPVGEELHAAPGALVLDRSFHMPESGNLVQKFVARRAAMARQTIDVTFCYDETDAAGLVRRLSLPFTMRWLYRYEGEHLLARAGLQVEGVYGSYDLDDYDDHAERMILIGAKP
jgi:SAM-dependent methyltransferase